jgi:hypothetical protein
MWAPDAVWQQTMHPDSRDEHKYDNRDAATSDGRARQANHYTPEFPRYLAIIFVNLMQMWTWCSFARWMTEECFGPNALANIDEMVHPRSGRHLKSARKVCSLFFMDEEHSLSDCRHRY